MHTSFWQLGWRTLWRDVRSGELRLLMLAVVLSVAAVAAVGFFADRLQSGLEHDAHELLGGDLVVVSDAAPAPAFLAQARELGLSAVTSLAFPTMARAPDALGGASRLVGLKAVSPGYPLRGVMRLANDVPTRAIPKSGEAWVDPAVLDALQLHVGESLWLGERSLRIVAVISQEPDRGAGFMNLAPRVMISMDDVPSTGLVQPASRLNYRLALAGPDAVVQRYAVWAEALLAQGAKSGDARLRGHRVESVKGGRPEITQTLERADKFLRLVSLLASLLSAVAVALAARAFAASHLDDCAMLRVLGLAQSTIARAYALEFLLAGLFASSLGVLLGYVAHFLLVALMAGLLDVALPAATLWPAGLGLGVGMTLLLAFGLPPVLQLAQVPALRVIRRDVGALQPASVAVLTLGLAGFSALLLAASSDLQLGLIAVGGFAAATLIFGAVSWLAVRLLRRSVNERTAPRWLVLATRQVAAQPAYTVLQVSALALGLLALVLLVLLRTDLIDSWRQATPVDAPNRFVINIMPDQGDAFRAALQKAGVTRFDWYPMMRGRLISINGRNVSSRDYKEERAQHMVDREFNLSNSTVLPDRNVVVAGAWKAGEADAISVEEGIAELLHLKIGDRLRFDIGGVQQESRITSLRKVDWGSMRANFFAMYPLERVDNVPATYLAAFRSPSAAGFDNALVHQFPNVTSVDISTTLNQVQRVLEQVTRAVEFLFVFTLTAGLVVLIAAVAATREERARSYAIMRAVGASAGLLRQVQRAELIGVGVLAGLLASVLASVIGWALAHYVFQFEWTGSWSIILLGAASGGLLAWLAGWWGLRGLLRRPVVETLRRAAT